MGFEFAQTLLLDAGTGEFVRVPTDADKANVPYEHNPEWEFCGSHELLRPSERAVFGDGARRVIMQSKGALVSQAEACLGWITREKIDRLRNPLSSHMYDDSRDRIGKWLFTRRQVDDLLLCVESALAVGDALTERDWYAMTSRLWDWDRRAVRGELCRHKYETPAVDPLSASAAEEWTVHFGDDDAVYELCRGRMQRRQALAVAALLSIEFDFGGGSLWVTTGLGRVYRFASPMYGAGRLDGVEVTGKNGIDGVERWCLPATTTCHATLATRGHVYGAKAFADVAASRHGAEVRSAVAAVMVYGHTLSGLRVQAQTARTINRYINQPKTVSALLGKSGVDVEILPRDAYHRPLSAQESSPC